MLDGFRMRFGSTDEPWYWIDRQSLKELLDDCQAIAGASQESKPTCMLTIAGNGSTSLHFLKPQSQDPVVPAGRRHFEPRNTYTYALPHLIPIYDMLEAGEEIPGPEESTLVLEFTSYSRDGLDPDDFETAHILRGSIYEAPPGSAVHPIIRIEDGAATLFAGIPN